MNDFLQQMLPMVATLLGAVLTALAGYLVSYINKKTNETQLTKIITDSVMMLNNTYVDALKKDNAFTKEAQKEAFRLCYENVMSLLKKETLKYLETVTNDVEKYLKTSIEATVKKEKIESHHTLS